MKLKFIVLLILSLWILPSINDLLNLYEDAPLNGMGEYQESKPKFKFEDFVTNKFQTDLEQFVNQTFSFRKSFIRLSNQFNFSLLKHINSPGIILGKKNMLFQQQYLDEYIGKDLISESTAKENVRKLRVVDSLFKVKGKRLMYIIAPSKTYYFPEFLTGTFSRAKRTNYDIYSGLLKNSGIIHLDLNHWFIQKKNNTSYELYPQCGTHWSDFGAMTAFDTMYTMIERTTKFDLVNYHIGKNEESKIALETDYDLGNLSNLMFRIPEYKLGYPKVVFDSTITYKPNLLLVGDSYVWNLYNLNLLQSIFNINYAYYNDLLYNSDRWNNLKINRGNYKNNVDAAEMIVILQTTSNLKDFGFSFIDKMYFDFKLQGLIPEEQYDFNEPYPHSKLKMEVEMKLGDWLDKETSGLSHREGLNALWNNDGTFKSSFHERWVRDYYYFMGRLESDSDYLSEGFTERNFATYLVPHIKWWCTNLSGGNK